MKRALFLFCLVVMAQFAVAGEARPRAADPLTEKRLQALAEELRCLVCQNQSIADSNADLAVDLKREVRGMIQAGKSDQEIIAFMVARYGDFVLYKPPVKAVTWLLWGGPLLFMVIGLFVLLRNLRRRAALELAEDVPLSADEEKRAMMLLDDNKPPGL